MPLCYKDVTMQQSCDDMLALALKIDRVHILTHLWQLTLAITAATSISENTIYCVYSLNSVDFT